MSISDCWWVHQSHCPGKDPIMIFHSCFLCCTCCHTVLLNNQAFLFASCALCLFQISVPTYSVRSSSLTHIHIYAEILPLVTCLHVFTYTGFHKAPRRRCYTSPPHNSWDTSIFLGGNTPRWAWNRPPIDLRCHIRELRHTATVTRRDNHTVRRQRSRLVPLLSTPRSGIWGRSATF